MTLADYDCPMAMKAGRLNNSEYARLPRFHETGENGVSGGA